MKKTLEKFTFGEELANSLTHGIPALIMLVSIPIVSINAYNKGSILDVVGVNIFCISIFFMLTMSTLYHSMEWETKHKRVFKILDHSFIYVAIAGSYTPVALSVIGGWQGIVILSIQWSMVVLGIIYKSVALDKLPKLSLLIYIAMGWCIVAFWPILSKNSSIPLIALIVAGGLFYSLGAIFYAGGWFRYHHTVWHIFVMLGVTAHYIGICFYIF